MRTLGLILALSLAPSGFADTAWKAGAASVGITPREPIFLAGYGDRTHASVGVLHELHAKALALRDETGATTVLVTLDLLGLDRGVADAISGRVLKSYGVPRDRLALNSSHTHSGPVTGYTLRAAYAMDKAQADVVARYTDWMVGKVVEVVGSAIRELAPATLAFEQGSAGFAVNRRRVQLRQLPGPVDHDVPVLRVQGADGKLRAVIFTYACHATVLNTYEINGDWPGYAQSELEKANPGAIAMFVTGCGADANPLPRRSVDLAMKYGQIMANAVDQVLKGKMKPVGGPLKTAFETVDVPFAKPPTREEFRARLEDKNPSVRRHAQAMLDIFNRDGKLPDRYPYPVQIWQFGRDLKLIALGGEVVVDYALRLRAQYGWDNTWVAGYTNDVFAYIPSLRVLKEGGYEGGGAMIPYGQPGPFGAAVEEIIVEEVAQLAKRTGGQ